MALIGFGFTIYKVLDSMLIIRAGTLVMLRPQGQRNFGITLMATETFSLLAARVVYWKYVRRLDAQKRYGL